MGSNPHYKELLTLDWEDNEYWTSFFVKMVMGLVAISLIFPIFGSFVSLYVGLILLILPIVVALLGSYFLIQILTKIETYYVSDEELVIQSISFRKLQNEIHTTDNVDLIVVLVLGDDRESSSQEFFLWELDDPTTKLENLIFKSSPQNQNAIKIRQALVDIGFKMVDFYFEGIGICKTCVTIPAQYTKDTETTCPECNNRVKFY